MQAELSDSDLYTPGDPWSVKAQLCNVRITQTQENEVGGQVSAEVQYGKTELQGKDADGNARRYVVMVKESRHTALVQNARLIDDEGEEGRFTWEGERDLDVVKGDTQSHQGAHIESASGQPLKGGCTSSSLQAIIEDPDQSASLTLAVTCLAEDLNVKQALDETPQEIIELLAAKATDKRAAELLKELDESFILAQHCYKIGKSTE